MIQRTLERLVKLGLDTAAIFLSWYLTPAILAWGVAGFRSSTPGLSGMPSVWLVVGGWFLVATWLGVHHTPERPDRWDRLRSAARSSMALGFAVVTVAFFSASRLDWNSRLLAVSCVVLSSGLFLATRFGLHAGVRRLTGARRIKSHHIAVLGYDGPAFSMLEHLRSSATDEVRGLIVPEGREMSGAHSANVLGSTRQLAEVINREKLDRIVILNGSLTQGELEACTEVSNRMGVTMSCAVAVGAGAQNLSYSMHYGIPLVEIQPVSFTTADCLVKRAFDVIGSSLLLLLLSPILLLIAFLVKATSDGPIFYKAARVGRGGRYFTFLKFRSMYTDRGRATVQAKNEKDGHIFKIRNDPRITPLGRILRRYSLDELPQLINVFLGDMSLVGPRPLPIEDMEPDGMSRRFAIWSEQRASVPPGITGLWQIRGRSELPFADLIKYDLEYVHNWSLGLDLRILMETPRFVVSGKGAY